MSAMTTCDHCHIGSLQARQITYANWHAGLFIVMPNMPAWQCDVCAHLEIDAGALSKIMPLLGPVTQPDPTLPRRGRQARGSDTHQPAAESDHDHGRI